jgi:hypothetical protein
MLVGGNKGKFQEIYRKHKKQIFIKQFDTDRNSWFGLKLFPEKGITASLPLQPAGDSRRREAALL